MDYFKICIAAFSATNLMTTFSYMLSHHYKKLFKEPVLLSYIFQNMDFCPKGKWAIVCAWITHYAIGLFFVIGYNILWRNAVLPFGWLSGIGLGIISGIIGVFSWKIIFKLQKKPSKVHVKEYYVQLFFAHLLFAVAVVAAFKLYDFDPIAHASGVLNQ